MLDRTKQPEIKKFNEVKLDFPAPIKLSNGIPMWVIGNGEDEINRLTIYVGGGTYHDQVPLQSMFTGQMCLEGNRQMTSNQIAEALDFYGSFKSVQSYDHATGITLSSLNRNLEHTLPLLAACLDNPTFPEEEFNLFQQRLASNVATARRRVQFLANEEMKKLYYGKKHPLAQPLTAEGIMSVTLDDLKQFHSRHYNVNNCKIVFSGHITSREIAIVDHSIGQWKKTGKVSDNCPSEIVPSSQMLSIINKENALQSAVNISLRAIPRRHPDYFKLRLLVTALGGYFGSRLNANIREKKGYTYGISSILAGRAEDSYIAISSQCATQYTRPLIEEVKKEMVLLQTQPMPVHELETVKQYMLSDLVKTLDTPFDIAGYVGSTFVFGIYPEYFNNQVKAILSMTAKDLMEMAKKYLLPEKMRIVIAGDAKTVKTSLKNH